MRLFRSQKVYLKLETRTANAVRAIGRMNALRLVSQRRASKSNGSPSSEKTPTSPPPSSSSISSPVEQPTDGQGSERTPNAELKRKEKAEIDKSIDQESSATNTSTVPSIEVETPVNTQSNRDSYVKPETNGRALSFTLDSDVENDSGLDLSLDQNALGKRSARSSQNSFSEGRDELPGDLSLKTDGVNDNTRDQSVSLDKDGQQRNSVIDTNSVTSSSADKSDISLLSDASEDTSDPGVNMDRYLYDPNKGVKNQAARWEVRTNSPDRKSTKNKTGGGGGGGGQSPPQQAPVFRQKFRHCEVIAGSVACFECCVDGNPSPDIIWYKNGKRVQENERYRIMKGGEDIHSLVVKDVTKDDQGTYMCEARSPAGKARCSARLVVQQHPVSNNHEDKSSTSESKESPPARQNSTGRKFWQFNSSKNKDPRGDKLATPSKSSAPTASKQSFFSLSLDRRGSSRTEAEPRQQRDTRSSTVSPPRTSKSAVDKLKERADAFTKQYERKKEERQSLADRAPRRQSANISAYLQRYTRSASADRSSSFSIGSTSTSRRGSSASSTDEPDLAPYSRPRLATYATMIRSTQSIGALTAKFEKSKANGTDAPSKGTSSTLPRKDLKYNANLDAKKALFSSSSNGTTNSSPIKSKTKDPVSIVPRTAITAPPSTSSLRSKFETKSNGDKDGSFTRSIPGRQSTGRHSYLDKIDTKDRDISPSSSSSSSLSFNRSTAARHSTIGVMKSSSTDNKHDFRNSVNATRQEPARPVSTFTSPTKTSSVSSPVSSTNQKTYVSRYETVINSDSESSICSTTSSSTSEKKSRSTPSSSISSRYEMRSPVVEKPPSFIKKPQKLSASEGESATLSCMVEGEPKPEVTWSFRGKPLSDEGRVEIYEEKGTCYLEIFDLVTRDAGLYTCRIVNSAGRSSALVELVVNAKPKRPPFFLQKLSDCEVHEAGANGRLQCKLDGAPAPETSWLKEGKALQESDRVHFTQSANGIHALIIDDVTEDDDAIYTCIAKNKHGQVSSSAELIVEIDLPSKSEVDGLIDGSLHIDVDDIQPSSVTETPPIAVSSPAATKPTVSAPQFLDRPSSVTADQGKSARFSCSVSGFPLPVVTWAKDEKILEDEGRFEIYDEGREFIMEIFDLQPTDEGLYTVTAENSAGKAATGAELTVNRTKTAIEQPPPPAPYTNSLSYSDVRHDEAASSEDVPSLKSEQLIPEPIATNPTAFQPPSRIPPEFLALPTQRTITEPNSAKFNCRVVGDPKPTVTWSRNNVVLSDSGRYEIYEEKDEFILEIFDTTTEDSGVYVCTATNLAGQKLAEARLTVESSAPKGTIPEFIEKISGTAVRDGESAKFTCKLRGIPPPSVHWYYRNQEIVGSDEVYELHHQGETASLCLPEVLPEDEGEYSCTIKNDMGETSCSAFLKVQAASPKSTMPEFVQKLKDIQAIDGSPLSLPVRVAGSPDPDVQWFFNKEQIKEDNDFKFVRDGDRLSLVIAEVYPDDAGVYTCKIFNSAGSAECSCKVFVQESDIDGCPPKFVQKPRSINIDEGSSVTLSCKIDGEPLPTVTWIKDGRSIEPGRRFKMESSGISGTTRSLNIPTVLATDAGSYTCVLHNQYGGEQCSVNVVVKPLEEEQTDFRSLLKSRPRLQNISNSPNNVSSDKSEAEQVDFRHVLTRHVNTRKRPVFIKPIQDIEVVEGESVTFECHVDAIPEPTIIWTANKKEIKESKYFQMSYKDAVATLLIAEAFAEDEGDYTCTATNGVGTVSCTAELTVQDEENVNGQGLSIEEPVITLPRPNDTPRCVIESDCTHDKVASTFNVRLSKVVNGTPPSPPAPIQHNTNTNNNKEMISPPSEVQEISLSSFNKTSVSTEESASVSTLDNTESSSDYPAPDTADIVNGGGSTAPVMDPPSFLEPLKDTAVLEESSAMLKCKVVGEPEPEIYWYKDGVELKDGRKYKLDFPDDEVAVLIVKEAGLEDAGEYTCKAVNSAGTKESRAEIIVEAPACIKDAPKTLQVMAGRDLSVTCHFVAIPEPDVVMWSKNRKTVQENDRVRIDDTDTSTTLTVSKATHDDGGRYNLLVENDLGSDNAAIYVSVLDKPDPPVGKPIASNINRQSLTLSWTGSSYDGGSRITGYVIEMRTVDDDNWQKAEVVSNTSHTIDNLKPETEYLFRVSSENEYGISKPGQESDRILTVVEKKEKKDMRTTVTENDVEEIEFRHVTIKPDREFSEKYQIKDVLGKGRFGTVHKCIDKVTGKPYAAKMIKTIKSADKDSVKNEIGIMNKLHHAKLLQCLDAFESPKQMIMVLEIVNGGELFERVIDDDFGLTESDVIEFMRQICAGVQHMHSTNILHLDLKPENILCIDKTGSRIKLIDFGLAREFNPAQSTKVMFGTPEFVAPEVINYDAIGFTTDMWSVGVICYILLSGLSPFMGDNDAETLNNVTLAEWDFEDEAFDTISEDAKTFIEGLLIQRKEERMTAAECLQHKWLVTDSKELKCNKISTTKLKNFVARRRWQSDSSESNQESTNEDSSDETKTATAVRAIGRMASLSLFGSSKKSGENSNNLRSQSSPSSKDKSPSTPTTPSRITEDEDKAINNNAQIEKRSGSMHKDESKEMVAEAVVSKVQEKEHHSKMTDNDVKSNERQNGDDESDDESEEDVEDDIDGPGKKDLNQNIPGAPHFIKEMVDCEVFEGDSARFDCQVAGDPEPDIKWLQDGEEIEESSRFIFDYDDDGMCSLIIRRIQEDDEGEYCIKATNSKGEASCIADLLVEGF
ncbi:myosin light chain kinase, smooth muscle-like isoform X3 [Lytechinus variegatus]|uniref:myosin light chain kinase, smooth muscle-like isoform X3 n=1 Tax=Lytechinus variegatus TaxID=7654 RepID=UPI001BB16093|nr:myosin light chain kinase, smooth muscle-like isoform X3 [Lytechinus variegatus]